MNISADSKVLLVMDIYFNMMVVIIPVAMMMITVIIMFFITPCNA